MIKGKASVPVYIRLIKKKGRVHQTREFCDGVNIDLDDESSILGFEFLDCYGIEVNGKEISIEDRHDNTN